MADIDGRNYYELLGLEPDATTDAIKEAYREIARIYHPDSNFYDDIIADAGPEDSDVFKAITAAYQVLVNDEKRKAYDDTLPKGLDAWGDEDGPIRRASQAGEDEDEGDDPDIPEDWKKERQYFQEHFEEILKPGPRADLTSTADGSAILEGKGPFDTWGGGDTPQPSVLFGNLEAPVDEPAFDTIPVARRPLDGKMKDPVQLIMFIGLPLMTLVVVCELIFLR